MSASSISPVASSGSSAQAPAQPGAPDAAADTSPFAMLLAAIAAADPELQTTVQPSVTQAGPVTDGQPPALPGPQAANDDDAEPAIETAADLNTDSPLDPSAVTTPKSGTKPDKKSTTDKSDAEIAAAALPTQPQTPVLPQFPIAPMAQAAIQIQTVAGNDDGDDVSAATGVGANNATSAPRAPQPRVSGNLTTPDAPQAASSLTGIKETAQPLAALATADAGNDDGDQAGNITTDAISAAGQNGPAVQAAAGFAPPRNTNTKSAATPAAPGPATQAGADDTDTEIPPLDVKAPATLPPQAVAGGLQTASQNVPPAAAQHLPRKADQDTPVEASADPVTDTRLQPANAAPAAKDKIDNSNPASTAPLSNENDSKPLHVAASAAPQAQPDTSLPPPGAAAMPQNLVAINASGAPIAGSGPTLSVHITDHTSDSQSDTPSTATPNIDALAVSVAARSLGGSKQFDIRLDPPELGRVEVRLSIDASGKTQAHMTADQPQTLELLQKDATNLTRALRDAGLDVSQNGLNFSLKGQNQNGGGQSGNFGGASRGLSLPAIAQSIETAQPANIPYAMLGNARLDIHV